MSSFRSWRLKASGSYTGSRLSAQIKENHMQENDVVTGIFADHQTAETAVKKLAVDGFDMKTLSVVGKAYSSNETVIGLYHVDDKIKFWGARGAFWSNLWALFSYKVFLLTPETGPIVALGYLAAVAVSNIEGAAETDAAELLKTALCNIGITTDFATQYEADIKADNFIVMFHGDTNEAVRAREIMGTASPARLDMHTDVKSIIPLMPSASTRTHNARQ